MNIKREIAGSVEFESTGWKLNRLVTPRMTLNVIWCNAETPLMFGIQGDLDRSWALGFIESLKQIEWKQFVGKACALPDQAPFDCCGFIGGRDRRLLRGLVEDDAFVQAVPMYSCELRADHVLPPLYDFRNWTNIFDLRREPQPWFEYRMKGGASGLSVAVWRPERYAILKVFVRILRVEEAAWLEVKNQQGTVLMLPDANGWDDAELKIDDHLGYSGNIAFAAT
jgi:hypothetical protein